MRRFPVAIVAALAAAALTGMSPAHADTLIDNVNGLTLDDKGQVQRFSGVLVGDDGRIEQIFQRGDRRPKKVDFALDGKGKVMLPGLIAANAHVVRLGLALLLAKPSVTRAAGETPGGQPRPEDRDLAVMEAQQALLARGITTVTDMGTTIEDWQSYRRAGDAGALRMRIIAYAGGVDAMILIGGPGPSPWLYEDRLRLTGVALAPDGPRPLSDTQLRNLMSRAAMDHFQIAVTARTAPAVTSVLGALDELTQTYKGERRWRIEQATAIAPADAPRIAALGVVMSGQSGATEPFADMAAALMRAGAPGQPDARMTREDALAAWTTQAAFAAFADERLGRIAQGRRADFLLIDRDPTLATPDELRATRVLETWVGGKRVWQAKDQALMTLP